MEEIIYPIYKQIISYTYELMNNISVDEVRVKEQPSLGCLDELW